MASHLFLVAMVAFGSVLGGDGVVGEVDAGGSDGGGAPKHAVQTTFEPTVNSSPNRVVDSSSEIYNTVNSESLMDYIEALPKSTIKKLLNEDELTDFVSAYEDQIFNRDTVFVHISDYAILHDAVAKILTPSQLSGLANLFTANVTRALPADRTISKGTVNSTATSTITSNSSASGSSTINKHPDFDICDESLADVPSLVQGNYSDSVKTVVRMEHVVVHPMINIYASKLGLSRILQHPNLLQQLRSKKNKLLGVLFLDMSLISLLETQLVCYKLLDEESMLVRFRVTFGKTLNAMELSAIPTYFNHISQFTSRALNRSSLIVELRDRNFTSSVIDIDRENRNPCLFFDLLGSCENGGFCVGFSGIGNCRCRKGFTGKLCSKTVKPKTNRTGSVPTEFSRNLSAVLLKETSKNLADFTSYPEFVLEEYGWLNRDVSFAVTRYRLFYWFKREFEFLYRLDSRVKHQPCDLDEEYIRLFRLKDAMKKKLIPEVRKELYKEVQKEVYDWYAKNMEGPGWRIVNQTTIPDDSERGFWAYLPYEFLAVVLGVIVVFACCECCCEICCSLFGEKIIRKIEKMRTKRLETDAAKKLTDEKNAKKSSKNRVVDLPPARKEAWA